MSADTKTYNGWSSYETWAVALWLGNEQSSDTFWREETQAAWDRAEANKTFTREERARYNLARTLKESITEDAPDLGASMWADLLGAALSEVNWDEIAANWLDDVDKSGDEAEDDETE